ncbi:MAG: hypothetical protein P8N09_13630 [Planctomycetota bacterium]|nr:hypothetical protein [Planctomycetota bacterium]
MSISSARSDFLSSSSSSKGMPFLQHIRRFRTRGEERRAAVKERENSRLLEELQGHLNALDFVDVVRGRIEGLAREFMEESPGFRLSRRLFDGRYMIEMTAQSSHSDALGRPVRDLSRLAFLLAPEGEGHLLTECHAMVRDHDLPVERIETPSCRSRGEMPVEEFLDEQFLNFARAYYSEGGEPEHGAKR